MLLLCARVLVFSTGFHVFISGHIEVSTYISQFIQFYIECVFDSIDLVGWIRNIILELVAFDCLSGCDMCFDHLNGYIRALSYFEWFYLCDFSCF